eukprot:6490777-Amphidinium_carterae.2
MMFGTTRCLDTTAMPMLEVVAQYVLVASLFSDRSVVRVLVRLVSSLPVNYLALPYNIRRHDSTNTDARYAVGP